MRILLCHNHYQQTGGEDLVYADESALLESQGHEVLHYTVHNDDIRNIGKLAAARKTIWNRQVGQEVSEIFKCQRPDIVHCTNIFPLMSPAIYYSARQARVPVVQSLHNYRLLCPRGDLLRNGVVCESCMNKSIPWPSVLHGCYRGSRSGSAVVAGMLSVHRAMRTWNHVVDRYIVPSKFARRKYMEGGFPSQKIVVKPNFVIQDSGMGTGGGGHMVFVGRLSKEKGLENLLSAWSRLGGSVSLKIVGDGPLRSLVQAAAARDDRIDWLGQISFEQVLSILGDAAALVFPSVCYETFGRTIIESFSKGTPVIASRHGAMAELIDDGQTGWLFEVGNPVELASKMELSLSDSQQRAGMRQAARNEFEHKYTSSANYEILMKIYQQVTDTANPQELGG